jgi:hypothetical protein
MLKRLIIVLELLVVEIRKHNELYANMLSQAQIERNKTSERVSSVITEIFNKAGKKYEQ